MKAGGSDPRESRFSHARGARGVHRLAGPLLVVATVALPFTWALPLFRTEFFYWFGNEVSILGAVRVLAATDWFLFAIVLVFGLLLPMGKLALMLAAWFVLPRAAARRWIAIAARLGKLAMLDLLLVAVSIVGFKGVGLGSVTIMPVFYLYAALVLAILGLSTWIEHLADGA